MKCWKKLHARAGGARKSSPEIDTKIAHPLVAARHTLEPFWLDDTPAPALGTPEPPGSADVAVVGAGYTGLTAALTLAREGRGVVVFDAEAAGYGCSSRNGGQCGGGLKPGFDGLSAR